MRTAVLCTLLFGACAAWGDDRSAEIDVASGLIIANGWEMVRAHCTACHSSSVITLQRGDRDAWKSMIRWMQKTQGLWQIEEGVEDTILTYLAANYPPGKSTRRRNLAPGDLP